MLISVHGTFSLFQGLDPRTTASMFADARCIGEKKIDGEDCFILKLCIDPETLKARILGYPSQQTLNEKDGSY